MNIETICSVDGGLYDRTSIKEDFDYIHNCDEPDYRKRRFRALRNFLQHFENADGPKLWAYMKREAKRPCIHFWTDDCLGNPHTHDVVPNCPSQTSIDSLSDGSFRVEFQMPHGNEPWVRRVGFASCVDEATNLLLAGLKRCEHDRTRIPPNSKPDNAG